MTAATQSTVRVFGVRHHGPGSARSLVRALDDLEPDVVLIEGPPDADELVAMAAHEGMEPPVALLVYVPDEPNRAAFYPYALYSPEWQAILHGVRRGVPVKFMDLPQWHQLALREEAAKAAEPSPSGEDRSCSLPTDDAPPLPFSVRRDPLGELARAAGYSDGERWWDHLVESRQDGADVFAAVHEAMAALREQVPGQAHRDDPLEAQREAWMRKTIRGAMADGYERIAVVCGAWHAPSLAEMPPAKADNELLRGLPKVKTTAAWAPWTYERLCYASGYGAGVESPEWYHLLWENRTTGHAKASNGSSPSILWLTRVARLMREHDLDASSAHVIEAVRLADMLAGLRGRSLAGLHELDEAALTVMCFGHEAPMRLIRRKLVVGDRLGCVPADAPSTPLQQDLAATQKRLRLPPKADEKDYDLDLRQPTDLARSQLLHRLRLLGVPWGQLRDGMRGKGTFHENWRLAWRPEFAVALVEASLLGNSVATAASAAVERAITMSDGLEQLAGLLDDALLADLGDAVAALMSAIANRSAVAADVAQLMRVVPALANVSRYGSVRQADASQVSQIVHGLVARIAIGLVNACASLDDDAAAAMRTAIMEVDGAVGLLQDEEDTRVWRGALRQLADAGSIHGLIAGRATRLLRDAGELEPAEAQRRLSLALSTANDPAAAAAWIEGFLSGSGLLLVHDAELLGSIDEWLCGLRGEQFQEVLPLVRRTFSTFAKPERRQIGERIKADGTTAAGTPADTHDFDVERARAVLPLLALILGKQDAGG